MRTHVVLTVANYNPAQQPAFPPGFEVGPTPILRTLITHAKPCQQTGVPADEDTMLSLSLPRPAGSAPPFWTVVVKEKLSEVTALLTAE